MSSLAHITPADAAMLILACLLHDIGMHLSQAGFLTLVKGEWQLPLPEFHDKPWPALWEEFLGEASRFDGRKLTALLGDSDPVNRREARNASSKATISTSATEK